ncbi:MAG: response regulator [Candidatus Omnitrophota bacterium]
MKILIADDETGVTDFLGYFLQQKGHVVDVAGNGKKALELLKKDKYSIIFLDYNMPEVTGLEVIQFIRENHMDIVVVMITGYPFVKEFLAKSVGADEYIHKPYDLGLIESILDKYAARVN